MRRDLARIPPTSLVLAYAPMLPLAAAAVGAWSLSAPWPALAARLAIIWGAMILVFLAGVRRGYGFGDAGASTAVEIAAMLVYFIIGGLALVAPTVRVGLGLLILGYALVPLLDGVAARHGDAPGYFARLRPPQMAVAVLALIGLFAR